jgi:hypothetical protein
MHPRTGLLVDVERQLWKLESDRAPRTATAEQRRETARRWLEKAIRAHETAQDLAPD